MEGGGRLILTGSLGDVLRESAQAALSLIRSRAKEYEIPAELFKDYDLHIHFPAGAIPKDGPSAGITIFIALLSLLTKRPCRADVALTGEMTLSGRVFVITSYSIHYTKLYERVVRRWSGPSARIPAECAPGRTGQLFKPLGEKP